MANVTGVGVDPVAACIGAIVAVAGATGVVAQWMTADDLALIAGAILSLAATMRAIWLRQA